MKLRKSVQKLSNQVYEELWIGIRAALLPALMLSISLAGCVNKPTVLHVIEGSDIVMLKEGEQFTAPKQGAFLSDEYIGEVMLAKVELK